jgi:hypothetical protein
VQLKSIAREVMTRLELQTMAASRKKIFNDKSMSEWEGRNSRG